VETGDAAGSYLVPPEFRQQIVDLVFSGEDPIMNLIQPDPTASNRVVGLGDERERRRGREHVVDGRLDDGVCLVESLANLDCTGIGHQRKDA
jgi:hypothetical protein